MFGLFLISGSRYQTLLDRSGKEIDEEFAAQSPTIQ
jgi:hypothetical protein